MVGKIQAGLLVLFSAYYSRAREECCFNHTSKEHIQKKRFNVLRKWVVYTALLVRHRNEAKYSLKSSRDFGYSS